MVRVAICDDEVEWIEAASSIVNNFFNEKTIELTIKTFDSAEPLLEMAVERKGFFDILILDIDMPDFNGLDAAEKLKKLYPNMLLVFYTAYEQYVFDSFKFQPFRYIRKEYAVRELKSALLAALQIIKARVDWFVELKTVDKTYNVKNSEIIYFETNKRRCDVYLKNGNIISIRKTIKEFYAEMGRENFIMIHSGAVVNAKYIVCFSNKDVTLENGKSLPVSRTRSKDVKDAISDYWRKRIW